MANANTDDDDISLPSDTLAVLQGFLKEKAEREALEESLYNQSQDTVAQPLNFEEDWQLSQFWYTEETAEKVAHEAIKQSKGGPIACVSTPSIFRALKKINPPNEFYVFEYDQRFRAYGKQFVYYDYNNPLAVPQFTRGHFDCIVLDPPFLSEECFAKAAQTATQLSKRVDTPIFVLTGKVMEPLIMQQFKNVQLCSFEPKHQRNLQNQFGCWTNCSTSSLL